MAKGLRTYKTFSIDELKKGLSEIEIVNVVVNGNIRLWDDFADIQKEAAMSNSYVELCKALTKKQQHEHYDEHGVLDYSTFI